MGIAPLPPVCHISHFMLQIQQRINNMLQSLREFLIHAGVGWAIGFICTILLAFWIIYAWVSDANPGTQMGIGLGGCIGVIGFAFGREGGAAGVAMGVLLGGFIGGEINGGWLLTVFRGR